MDIKKIKTKDGLMTVIYNQDLKEKGNKNTTFTSSNTPTQEWIALWNELKEHFFEVCRMNNNQKKSYEFCTIQSISLSESEDKDGEMVQGITITALIELPNYDQKTILTLNTPHIRGENMTVELLDLIEIIKAKTIDYMQGDYENKQTNLLQIA